MIRVFEINFPSLYLRDCRGPCECFCVCKTAGERRLAGVRLCFNLPGTCTLSPVPIKGEECVVR